MKVEGDKIILTFTETGRGLTCKGKELSILLLQVKTENLCGQML